MKKIFSSLLICLLLVTENKAQPTINIPETAFVKPYKLEVGYSTTTEIIFPVTLIPPVDRGSRDIIVQQEKSVQNILKVKAARKNFQPTNLHVYTKDGRLYEFQVSYLEYPSPTTFDLTKLADDRAASQAITTDDFNAVQFSQIAWLVKHLPAAFSSSERRYGMQLQLRTIHSINNTLVFGLRLVNRSKLGYPIDFTRMYIRDRRQTKHSSVQEQEILPVYTDSLKQIAGENKLQFVIIVPQFTIPDKKEFFIEVFEQNGGRRISLRIKNRQLLNAKSL